MNDQRDVPRPPRDAVDPWGPGLRNGENNRALLETLAFAPQRLFSAETQAPGEQRRMFQRLDRTLEMDSHQWHLSPRLHSPCKLLAALHVLGLLALLIQMHLTFVDQPGCADVIFASGAAREAHVLEVKVHGLRSRLSEAEAAPDAHDDSGATLEGSESVDEETCAAAPDSPGFFSAWLEQWVGWEMALADRAAARLAAPPPLKTALEQLLDERGVVWLRRVEEALLAPFLWGDDHQLDPAPAGDAKDGTTADSGTENRESRRSEGENFPVSGSSTSSIAAAQAVSTAGREATSAVADVDPVYRFSSELAFLMLSREMRATHGILTTTVNVSSEHPCFGGGWTSKFFDLWLGYDTVIINSVFHQRTCGFLTNNQLRALHKVECGAVAHSDASSALERGAEEALKWLVALVSSLFVCGVSTLAVSFTLRETLARMLNLMFELQQPLHNQRSSRDSRRVFCQALESLVFVPIMIGITFFLFDMFEDHVLAALVMGTTWTCELFLLVNENAAPFPRFFFFSFIMFLLYFFVYPRGFTYLAFYTHASFMIFAAMHVTSRSSQPSRPNNGRRMRSLSLGTLGR
mmetsp:Transcript_26506/g.50364  ORF Transcript_26506/g.50364 Transcript_26506/m.50364 type:complete len:578 (-) Transcript_26506:221-1954(-)